MIEAPHKIINRHNGIKFVIAGTGPMTEEMKNRVRDMGIKGKFVFIGYME